MNKNITVGQGRTVQQGWFSAAIGGAWRLIGQGIEQPADELLRAEVRTLIVPHLPVLLHKRAKCSDDSGVFDSAHWYDELESFVARVLWPQLAGNSAPVGRSKAQIADMLNEIVASEQRKAAEKAIDLPHTSRFDTSWAL